MKIAIGLTTKNRRKSALLAVLNWRKMLPENAVLFIVDDASDEPFPESDYRFEQSVGICHAKNKALELCYNSEAHHIFIVDDDVFPNNPDWYIPYYTGLFNHACWNYDRKVIFDMDRDWVQLETPNGCVLYFTNYVISKVGGWDTDFKVWGYEHVNLSNRIHNNNLTPVLYLDAHNTKHLFTMINVQSSVSDRSRVSTNYDMFKAKFYSKEFKPFK